METKTMSDECFKLNNDKCLMDQNIKCTIDQSQALKQAMSKKQFKKLRKREKWLEVKTEVRKLQKEKRKKKATERKLCGMDLGPSRRLLKTRKIADSKCHQKVVIDCSFDEFMTEKDIMFLAQQIQNSYAANRRSQEPLQLYVCGLGGKLKERLDTIGDYNGWDVYKETKGFREMFSAEDIIYLSSESPNVLDSLDETKVYVIGGLVDHNHHKGICYRRAVEGGLVHAQLPLDRFLQLKSRKVLTINHVFEILLHCTEAKDWRSSFLAVLPRRKVVSTEYSVDKASVCCTHSMPTSAENESNSVYMNSMIRDSDSIGMVSISMDNESSSTDMSCL